jgi:phosphatidylglycerol:prolipoprotein diacylglycerol transferase
MNPRAYYTLFMFLSAVTFLVVRRLQPRSLNNSGLSPGERAAFGLAAFVGGVLGAKLPFVFSEPSAFWQPEAWLGDGKTIVTGLIGAYVSVEVAKVMLGVRARTGDGYALPLACALAVGRWGCFGNGCCYGTPCDLPWGVDFLGDGVRRHPTQAYESLFHAGMAVVLLLAIRLDLLPTHRLKLYLIAYCVYRFLTEFIRPEPRGWLGLTFYQGAALALGAGLALQWALSCRAEGDRDGSVRTGLPLRSVRP